METINNLYPITLILSLLRDQRQRILVRERKLVSALYCVFHLWKGLYPTLTLDERLAFPGSHIVVGKGLKTSSPLKPKILKPSASPLLSIIHLAKRENLALVEY